MIVTDTNIIMYAFLSGDFTHFAEQLMEKDSMWAAPYLWRSECRNALALYVQLERLTLPYVIQVMREIQHFMEDNEYTVSSKRVLKLASESGCSAYDCEFVALAQMLEIPLVTMDKKVLRVFPKTAISLEDSIR